MRPNNSVGGYRIYPSSPAEAENEDLCVAALGQFNEGMDRLNRERRLTQMQQQLINRLDPGSQLARRYQNLRSSSARLWRQALAEQLEQNGVIRNEETASYTTAEFGQILIDCADQWQQFKRELEE